MKPKPTKTPMIPDSVKVLVLVALLLGCGVYGWTLFDKFRGIPEKPPEPVVAVGREQVAPPERPRHPRSPEERQKRRQEMMEGLNFTDEQKAKMDELWAQGRPEGREGWRGRMDAMREIATPEQEAQFMQMMAQRMSQRMERMRKTLSPEDFDTLQNRIQDRMRDGGFGGGRGFGRMFGGGGGSGGSPPSSPPSR